MMLEDGQEILVEQSLPVKNDAILGAGRDIYSQYSLNRHNSRVTTCILPDGS